jgi:hypothetical protein
LARQDAALLAAGPAVMVMHMGWACGFLAFHARRSVAPGRNAAADQRDRVPASE